MIVYQPDCLPNAMIVYVVYEHGPPGLAIFQHCHFGFILGSILDQFWELLRIQNQLNCAMCAFPGNLAMARSGRLAGGPLAACWRPGQQPWRPPGGPLTAHPHGLRTSYSDNRGWERARQLVWLPSCGSLWTKQRVPTDAQTFRRTPQLLRGLTCFAD